MSEAVEPGEHVWWNWHGLECCKICGMVRRRDDKNSPCKGTVTIGPRRPVEDGR
jgi:hypothetical protein